MIQFPLFLSYVTNYFNVVNISITLMFFKNWNVKARIFFKGGLFVLAKMVLDFSKSLPKNKIHSTDRIIHVRRLFFTENKLQLLCYGALDRPLGGFANNKRKENIYLTLK